MRKSCLFGDFDGPYWPTPEQLQKYFLGPSAKQQWPFPRHYDTGMLEGVGLYGTEHLPDDQPVTVQLSVNGNPAAGAMLQYTRWDGRIRRRVAYNSRGDFNRLRKFVRNTEGFLLSKGLFIPFETAWKAVKQFIEADGELPTNIEWIARHKLPPGTFPDP
jgi:hypothetical protein